MTANGLRERTNNFLSGSFRTYSFQEGVSGLLAKAFCT